MFEVELEVVYELSSTLFIYMNINSYLPVLKLLDMLITLGEGAELRL